MIRTAVRVRLRPMRLSDLSQVTDIDRLCFPTPWPARSYRYEVAESRNSTMFTIALPGTQFPENGSGLSGWLNRVWHDVTDTEQVIGYSGMWHIAEEVHISTIGVHPEWRGQSLGELLLYAMVRESVRRRAKLTTLEVRVSNHVALGLYEKYGFEIVGRRKNYYRDNREDAWMMSVHSSKQGYAARLNQLGTALFEKLDVIDEF